MITKNLSTLKVNKLTQAQYDAALFAGNIKDDELYLTPDTEYSRYTTVVSSTGTSEIEIGATIESLSTLSVYQNGLLLTYGTHYVVNESMDSIILIEYTADAGDIFTFIAGLVTGDITGNTVLRGSIVATAGQSAITIPLTLVSTSGCMVYENGILLEEGTSFEFNSIDEITLLGYTAEAGDIYTFVSGAGVAGSSATTAANLVTLNSNSFTETNVQAALEYLKDNLNSGDFLPRAGGDVTGTFAITATDGITLQNASNKTFSINSSQLKGPVNIFGTTATLTTSSGISIDAASNPITISSPIIQNTKDTSVSSVTDYSFRNTIISTSEPSASDTAPIGTVWLVYEE